MSQKDRPGRRIGSERAVRRLTALSRPFVVGSLREETVAETVCTIQNAQSGGAEAFSLHLSRLRTDQRAPGELARIFASTNAPILSLNYRNDVPRSDEDRVSELLSAVRLGASAVDIPGDTFDPKPTDWFGEQPGRVFDGQPREVSATSSAVQRQSELIEEVHSLGGEVMISAHVRMPLEAERVREIVEDFAERGADIVKVVTLCLEDAHIVEAVRTMVMLRETQRVAYQFQCHGEKGKITRLIGPLLGSMLMFANERYTAHSLRAQPLIWAARAALDNSRWTEPLPDPLSEFAGA